MKKFFRALFLILLALSTLCTTFGFAVKYFLDDPMVLYSYMTTAAYDTAVNDSVMAALEKRQMVFAIDIDKVKEVIDPGTIQYESRQVLRSISEHIINNESFVQADYQSTALYEVVEEEIGRLAKEYNQTPSDTAVVEVYSAICDTINNEINMLSEDYYQKIPTISQYKVYFNGAYIALIIGIISALALAYMYRHRVFYMIYKIAAAIWIGAAFICFPFGVLFKYDLSKNLALTVSPFSILIKSVYNAIIENIFMAGALVVIIATIMLVLAIFLIMNKNPRKRRHRHRRKKRKSGDYYHGHSKKSDSSEDDDEEIEEIEEKANFIDIEEELNRVNNKED